jgi:hypothetical protein
MDSGEIETETIKGKKYWLLPEFVLASLLCLLIKWTLSPSLSIC